jgi:putative PIN family toxin of toxin-antitoxin system
MKIVLDTNVCLDLFVFHDPRWVKLLDALTNHAVQAYTRADCRQEWLIVLDYPHLPLDAQSKEISKGHFDACIICLPLPIATEQAVARLPTCSDPDDQKFLEIARDSHADVLITKDKALLKLAKKTAKAGMFQIMTPETWVKQWQDSHPDC